MLCVPPVVPRRVFREIIALFGPVLILVGCQSYEEVPLDIPSYGAAFEARLTNTEPVTAFAQRLEAAGQAVPDEFSFEDGISYAEGEVLALFYNPELRISRLEAGVALATRENAGLWDDPVFGFDGAEIVSPPTPFEYGLMLSLTIPISGRLEVEKDRAGAAYEAELREVANAEWQLRADLRSQWATWTAAVVQAELLTDMIDDLQEINRIADRLETAGELNRVERRLLRIQLADMQIQASELQLKTIAAEVALLELLGLPPTASALLIPAFPETTPPMVDDVTKRLIDANTELAVHFARYETAEQDLRLEIKKQFPDIVIGSGYGTQFNDHRVMFGVSIPIPILNANRKAIAEASARREVVRAEAETTYARLIRNLAGATTALELKETQRDRYEQEIVPMLDAQKDDIQRIADLDELDMFVLLETITRMRDAKEKLITLRLDELKSAIAVHEILGPDHTPTTPAKRTDTVVAGGIQ